MREYKERMSKKKEPTQSELNEKLIIEAQEYKSYEPSSTPYKPPRINQSQELGESQTLQNTLNTS